MPTQHWIAASLSALYLLSVLCCAAAQDTRSDTWAATDALGRALPGFKECGPPRPDRTVGIFYFLWLGSHVNGGPWDVSRILAQDPQAMSKPDSPLWGPLGAMHHWGEPLFGYYNTDDAYVLRKHAQMLSDAGVDFVVFDVTNQVTYKAYYMALLRVWSEVRRAGGKTPQVAFLCPFWDPPKVAAELYHDLYEPGLYPDLWFRWDGKPLILADPNLLGAGEGTDQQNTPARVEPGHSLGQSFTVAAPFTAVGGRFPTWASRGSAMTLTLTQGGREVAQQRFENVDDNAWLSLRFAQPQPAGTYTLEMSEAKGTVGWWSHTGNVYPKGEALADGRPCGGDRTLRIETTTDRTARIREFFTFRKPQADYFRGPTAPDEWSWLEIHPQHVFRNAKGEKEQMSVGAAQNAVGGRLGCLSEPGACGRSFHNGADDPDPNATAKGLNFAEQWERALKEDPRVIFITGWNEWIASRFNEFAGVKLPVMFVDEFDQEHSRDIEPMEGGHGDAYYYQMVSYIRRYKGVRQPEPPSPAKSISLQRSFARWASVRPEYRDDAGDLARRDHPGYNNCAHYTNTTGRNDFLALKVARDARNLYFYARTKDAITPHTDPGWMMLFIDADGDRRTGWEGYDFVVNRTVKDDTTTLLEANAGGWQWRPAGEVRYRVQGNELMLAVPRTLLGTKGRLRFDFKWADNTQCEGDINAFTLNGDAAPSGRFNYRYEE